MIGILTGLLTVLPLTIIKVFLKAKKTLLKVIGFILMIGVVGLCYYVAIAGAA